MLVFVEVKYGFYLFEGRTRLLWLCQSQHLSFQQMWYWVDRRGEGGGPEGTFE